MLVLDLDRFKSVNDNYGHDIGDLVLRQVATRLDEITREHDVVARLGGEEFAVILINQPFSTGAALAEKIVRRVQQERISHPDSEVSSYLSVSVGFSHTSRTKLESIEQLFSDADAQLYKAKSSGRNRVMHKESQSGRETPSLIAT